MTYQQAQQIVAKSIDARHGAGKTPATVALLAAILDDSATEGDIAAFETYHLQEFFADTVPTVDIAADLYREANPPIVRPPGSIAADTFIASLSLYVFTGGRHGA